MTASASQPGIDIPSIKNQLNQLKALYDSGALKAYAYHDAKDALERKLVDWALLQSPTALAEKAVADKPKSAIPVSSSSASSPESAHSETKPRKSPLPVAAGIVVLAVLAVGGYFLFGQPEGTPVMPLPASSLSSPLLPVQSSANAGTNADKAPHSTQVGDIATMADKLAARLAKQPNDPQGWAMLGRSYSVLGSPAQAVKAYEKAVAMLPDDKTLKADYAAALAEVKKNNSAVVGGPVGLAPALASAQPPSTGQAPAAGANASVSGTVTLAAALAKNAQPSDTVFVVAKAVGGPPMPLAVLRKQVKDLPIQFTLDDSMSMSPAATLSGAAKVIVSARISKSGNAIAEKGDLTGQTAPVTVGAKALAIEINTAVK